MKRSFLILSLLIIFCHTVQGLVPRMIEGTHDESITTLKVDEDGRLCYSSLRGLFTYDGTESSDIITGINVLDFFPEKGNGYWIATPSFIGHMLGNGTLERFNTLRYGNKKKILDIDLETLLFTNDDGVYIMDKESGETIMELFKKINQEKGMTIMQVTHSEKNSHYGTRLVNLDNGKLI